MGRPVDRRRWDCHSHRGSPVELGAHRHHRHSHSYGGPGSMGSLGHRRDVPFAAGAAAASTSAVSKRNQDQGECSSSRRFEPLCPGYRAHSQRPATGPRPGGRRRRRSDGELRNAETVPRGCPDHPDSLNWLFRPHTSRLPATDPGPSCP